MSSRTRVISAASIAFFIVLGDQCGPLLAAAPDQQPIRVGIIGLDTSHVVSFTRLLNRPDADDAVPGARVVAAFPQGSRDIESSVSRVPGYTKTLRELGVEIVPSIADLLPKVDAVMLESNDGRVHLEQAAPVLAAGKPLFIDKPMAASLADVMTIVQLSVQFDTPVFSTSCLRFGEGTQAVRNGVVGDVYGCDVYSPDAIEPTHPDFFWYGIHGCEALFTVMGAGCESVTRVSTPNGDVVIGRWKGGRIGTFRALRAGKRDYGGIAFGANQVMAVGKNPGYRPLVVEIVKFFKTGAPPVDPKETLELFAFLEAAGESRRRAGAAVPIAEVFSLAEAESQRRLGDHRAPKK